MKKILLLIILILLCGCGKTNQETTSNAEAMELSYAEMFSVDFYNNKDYALIKIKDGEKYLLVSQGCAAPENVPEDITIIKQPISNVYLAASSALDLFYGLDSLDSIKAVSTKEKDWSLPYAKTALQNEDIVYVGKYSSPDYELVADLCNVAIESTMIYHCPEVKEQLEALGIPVIVERSSYEQHPLGRLEWIKLYGLLLGKEQQANDFFNEKIKLLSNIENQPSGKSVAFFYITSNGSVNVRKPSDYVVKMIEMAGGKYILPPQESDNASSTMNMQFESFYAAAKDADILIYNSTIDGGIKSVEDLKAKNSLFADFKAVKNGDVWCSDKNLFQQTTCMSDMIKAMNGVFNNGDDGFNGEYFKHIE